MADLPSISSSNIEFGLDLFHKLSDSKPDSNLFYSPISISFALAMTYLGTNANTKEEIKSVMKFDKISEDELHSLFKELKDHLLETEGKYILHIANKLYGEKSYKFLEEFLTSCVKFYGAQLEPVDFKSNADGCRLIINKWVEEQTNEKIKNLIAPGVLGTLTRLVLVNAIYFKGNWEQKFDVNHTKEDDFHITNSSSIKVPMMHFHKKKFNYSYNEELNSQVVELPYVGHRLSFVVILPDLFKTDLSSVERQLTGDFLVNICHELHEREMQLWLPRFKLESSFDVLDRLAELGIKDLFDERNADLSQMDGTKELYVSNVLHKAFIEVNEEGSEAAAATAAVIMTRCAVIHLDPIKVKVDHPFIFFIRDNTTGAILFLGKIVKP